MSDLVTKKDCDNNIKLMSKEIQDIKDTVNDIRVDIAGLPQKLAEKFDERYAPRWVAKAWVFVFTGIGGCLIIAVMASIFKGDV